MATYNQTPGPWFLQFIKEQHYDRKPKRDKADRAEAIISAPWDAQTAHYAMRLEVAVVKARNLNDIFLMKDAPAILQQRDDLLAAAEAAVSILSEIGGEVLRIDRWDIDIAQESLSAAIAKAKG